MRDRLCFVCKQDVLGLSGQDATMDTVWLGGGSVDSLRVTFRNAFGPCHLRCLADSTWGRIWARAYAAHEEQQNGSPLFYSDGIHVLFRRERLKETRLVSQYGWMATITDAALHQAVPTENGYLAPVRHVLRRDLSDRPQLLQSVQAALLRQGTYPLLALVQAFGVEARLLYPSAVVNGVLRPVRDDTNAAVPSTLSPSSFLEVAAEYACFVPQDIGDLMLAHIPPPAPPKDVEGAALIQAVKDNAPDRVEALLNRGVNVDSRDEQEWTPLMWAATLDNVELTRLLLAHGADVKAGDVSGDTALAFAAGGKPQIMQMLREAGS